MSGEGWLSWTRASRSVRAVVVVNPWPSISSASAERKLGSSSTARAWGIVASIDLGQRPVYLKGRQPPRALRQEAHRAALRRHDAARHLEARLRAGGGGPRLRRRRRRR